jgi:2-C-methyl-D-erythritol 4-phosphate cytidylyltransferase/2-C-methyl-D-erythritol 2,4-cyclodiphosphate synthase
VAVIVAAGTGERLGRATPKAFVRLGDRPMVAFSVETAAISQAMDRLVVVVPPAVGIDELAPIRIAARGVPVEFVTGASTRQGSVRLGLERVPADARLVVVHDAARPFASPALFLRVVVAVMPDAEGRSPGGAIPVMPAADTVKLVRDGWVVSTVSRDEVAFSQTPQAFVASALRQAHEDAERDGLEGTDDAMLLEAAGFEVATIRGEASNLKITTREDLKDAARLVAEGQPVWSRPLGPTRSAGSSGPFTDGKAT